MLLPDFKKDKNRQQVMKKIDIKKLFKTDLGLFFIAVDFSQRIKINNNIGL
jgi:hypothetical protein